MITFDEFWVLNLTELQSEWYVNFPKADFIEQKELSKNFNAIKYYILL